MVYGPSFLVHLVLKSLRFFKPHIQLEASASEAFRSSVLALQLRGFKIRREGEVKMRTEHGVPFAWQLGLVYYTVGVGDSRS